jgi:superfamily II DNA or RNA helicase
MGDWEKSVIIAAVSYFTIAMNPYSEVAQQRQELIAHYEKVTPIERLILQVSSLIYGIVHRAALMKCCNECCEIDRKLKKFTQASFDRAVASLVERRLMILTPGSGIECHPQLKEIATRDAIEMERFEPFVLTIEEVLPLKVQWHNAPIVPRSLDQFLRVARWAIYRDDLDSLKDVVKLAKQFVYDDKTKATIEEALYQVWSNPFDEHWVASYVTATQEQILQVLLKRSLLTLEPIPAVMYYAEELLAAAEPISDAIRMLMAQHFLLQNQLAQVETCLTGVTPKKREDAGEYWGWLSFLQQKDQNAIQIYQSAWVRLGKTSKKRYLYFDGISGIFFILALMREGSAQYQQLAVKYCSVVLPQPKHPLYHVYLRLISVLRFLQGDLAQQRVLVQTIRGDVQNANAIEILVDCLCLYWMGLASESTFMVPYLLEVYELGDLGEYDWVAMEAAALLEHFVGKKSNVDWGARSQSLREKSGVGSVLNLIVPTAPWELSLNALTKLVQKDEPLATETTKDTRLCWFITWFPNHWSIQPKEQKMTAKGGWSKGRVIGLRRLYGDQVQGAEFNYLSDQDREVCSHIKVDYYQYNYYGYGSDGSYRFDEQAIVALVGHPLVFWEHLPDARVEIVKTEPELLVKKIKDDQLALSLSPRVTVDKNAIVEKETPTRLRVTAINESHRKIANILGDRNELIVPSAAEERVLSAIGAIAGLVTVHSDIGGGSIENVEELPADPRPYIHLLPADGGLRVAVLVKPFAIGGSYYQPGNGGSNVFAEIDGKRVQTNRQLKEEKQLAQAAIGACSILEEWEPENGEWVIVEPSDCLELLLELQELGETVTLEWPEGEKFRVKNQLSSTDFHMNIKRQRDWFEADGELKIGNDEVLNMQQLMQLLENSTGRFVPLGDGQFLALTETFRKQLQDLRGFSEKHGEGVRFHPLASLALEDVVDQFGDLKTDKAWKEHTKKLKSAQNYQPKLPSTLQADLRDYQLEGFEWLSRLAHWGVGACLADDMGLGKTLQALSLILTRAANGPTLVLAPLSVCMNWVSEAAKFAPTLNVVQFGSTDRQQTMDNLQPLDLFVCSYGLLQQDDVAEMLAKVAWQTIVLDEAQAIKNMNTKRSQAAMKLQAEFKLITTGTPIENHLGELWNLFRFINPGLLGSLENFNQKYAGPIEREQDKDARQRLKKLIQPFMLRRTKNQVLSELPSRTEILLQVELTQEEKAFYEALRQDAIRKLSESDLEAGSQHLQVLAEIMKLRRACCNPALVQSKLKIKSSKLELFGETLTELLDNNHKALVFSQFVDHLTIIREYLDQHQISYQYLDGSTPAKERKKRVDAFQAGEGDVFLISLKAGGTGLNLTAADYVIHMDPWWNPAVEDQASDRAHRIGQQRPVTIYRLVAKGTIEDKIIDLHQQKRDLANSLLEGTEMSGKISTEQLLRLIQEE